VRSWVPFLAQEKEREREREEERKREKKEKYCVNCIN
jgi:hypothetical protein